ncbi:MAG: hypothetical protein AMXMBFR46_17570 [Acidimicrobiia bacterium]
MLLWYIGLSVLLVANVFRSVGLDYRLIAAGSMLVLLVDLPVGHRAFGHSLAFAACALVVVMAWPLRGSRLARRRWLCVPIGIFAGLVLSGAWTDTEVFWWPLFGTSFGDVPLLGAWWVVVLEEIVGLVACWWVVGQFDLYLEPVRRDFWRSGRLRATEGPSA